ncbi:hypothetical protein LEMLEM_LOCUS18122 [Lemmus lemmus]
MLTGTNRKSTGIMSHMW